MDSINLGIIGPFIFALLEGLKLAGLPVKFLPVISLTLAFVIAAVAVWYGGVFDPIAVLTNAGAIYLAIEGAFKNSKRKSQAELQK